jgi:hypothetical protein
MTRNGMSFQAEGEESLETLMKHTLAGNKPEIIPLEMKL